MFPGAGSINHSEAYSTEEANTNQAKSYFSRLRRMMDGQHHYVSARYLYQYACRSGVEGRSIAALPNGAAFNQTIRCAMKSPVSRTWKGYWNRATI